MLLRSLSDAAGGDQLRGRFLRSCDYAKPRQAYLMAQSELYDGGSSCVFSDMQDRLMEQHSS